MGGFTASQTFLSVDAMTTGLVDAPVSGLIGLAFQSIASTGATPFWLAVTSLFSAPEMSFWLARDLNPASGTSLASGGVFTLGGTDSTLFSGDIEFLDLASTPSYWLLPLSSLTVNGAAITLSTANALSAIDTGTTLIGAPHEDVVSLYSSIPGSQISSIQGGYYAFPCSTNVIVSMSFGGRSWSIDSRDFNTGEDPVLSSGSDRFCIGAIFDIGPSSDVGPGFPLWIVGATFLKNVYSVFRSDPPSVGFAQLSAAAS